MSDTTPGPWKHRHEWEVEAEDGQPIATCETYEDAQLIALVPEMTTMIRDQHKAIDYLLARLIALDKRFMPTQCAVWPVVVQGKALLDKIGG